MEWKNGKVAKTIVAPKSHEDRYSWDRHENFATIQDDHIYCN
jgi:hypothetical protein